MTVPTARRNIFRRHPVILGLGAIGIIAAVLAALMPKPEYKKLDYSQPIFTDDYAIICPQSLLFDIRADHDDHAVFELFTALTHREEKARALGCEVVRGDISVTAHRMAPPYDSYVAISIIGSPNSEFFTMEGDLKNGNTPANAGGSEARTQTAAQAILTSYEADRSRFQKELSTLKQPSPNLRWFPESMEDGDYPGQILQLLVTPYGPCASLMGNVQGYNVMSMHINPYMPNVPSQVIGNFANQAAASTAAEQYCHEWYTNESPKPKVAAETDHMWFTPDSEARENSTTDANSGDITPTPSMSSDHPNPVTPNTAEPQPAVSEEQLKWHTDPTNGDEILMTRSGRCATLALLSAHDPNKLHLNFSDGTTKIYPIDQTTDAMQAAIDYCRVK